MFSLFGPVKGSIKLPSVSIDNPVFRLHYKVSFVFLFASAILVTAKQYLGDPIDCIVEEIPQNVMDTYCWIHSTFSIPNAWFGREGFHYAHPGVAPPPNGEESFQYHKYYQWVALTLFFQACLFYLPHYIWKYCEDHKMRILTEGICVPIVDNEVRQSRINALVAYCKRNKDNHEPYAMKFYVCELLNLINIVSQIFFTDLFLDGQFSKYGTEVVSISEQDLSQRGDPMDRVFPKVAKCTFHKFGPSGTIEKFDGLCILPLNIINEKIYVFLWFWFIILAIISGFHAVYRLAMIFMPSFRSHILQLQTKMTDSGDLKELCKDMKLGDWFLFHQLARNVDSFIFAEFVQNYLRPFPKPTQTEEKKGQANSQECKHGKIDPEKIPLLNLDGTPREEKASVDSVSKHDEQSPARNDIGLSIPSPTMTVQATAQKEPNSRLSSSSDDNEGKKLDGIIHFQEQSAAKNMLKPSVPSPTTSEQPHESPNPKTPLPAPSSEPSDQSPRSPGQPTDSPNQVPSSDPLSSESSPESRVVDDPVSKDPHPKPVEVKVLKGSPEPSKPTETPASASPQVDPMDSAPPTLKTPEVTKSHASSATEEDTVERSPKTDEK